MSYEERIRLCRLGRHVMKDDTVTAWGTCRECRNEYQRAYRKEGGKGALWERNRRLRLKNKTRL